MPRVENKRVLLCNIQRAYEVIKDVTKYSEFIPWCKSVKVISANDAMIVSDVTVEFLFIKEHYKSMAKFVKPEQRGEEIFASSEITMIEGPFMHFLTLWTLESLGVNKTIVTFTCDFSFKNKLYNKIANSVMTAANQKIIDAFTKRVHSENDAVEI